MTKVDLAAMISEEAEKQALEPVEPLGTKNDEVEPAAQVDAETKRKTTKKRSRPKNAEPEPELEKLPAPRRTAWLREDHLDRLEVLKRREKARLRDDPEKRVAVTSLIDEAIEQYLAEME